MAKTITLITGCQRSGTTLMRLVMNAHPDVMSIDEDRFDFPSITTLTNMPSIPDTVALKLPRYAPLTAFINGLANHKVLWCIRHPLDVIWSMQKLHLPVSQTQTLPWAAHPSCAQTEIINTYYSLDPDQQTEMNADMRKFEKIAAGNPVQRSRIDNIFAAALCWKIKNLVPTLYERRRIGFYVVRYDDLVAAPEQALHEILDYVGVGWSPDVLRHHELHSGVSIGNTDNTRPIDARGVGSGKQNLSDDEVSLVRDVCGGVAASWGYAM